jgi:hypothetical protein
MSTDGVKAGRAYVELSVKDRLTRGLTAAKERLAGWAKGLALTGAALQGGSLSVLGTLGAAASHFADQGSQFNDLSAATGVGVEALSALSYAAKQTGVDVGALQGGLKGLAKFTGNVAAGSKGALHTLSQLGISASTFMAARPEQRLALLADGLQTIPDPGVRAALAMKTLGRAGESLLPMLADGSAGLNAFIDRAQELGIVITGEEAAKADALGDAWDDLKAVFGAIAFQTGAALADTLQTLIELTITGAQAALAFVRNNQGLVVALAATAVGGMVLGGVFLTLAGFGFALSGVMAGLNGLIAISAGAWTVLGAIKAGVAAINTWLAATLTAEGLAALWASIQTMVLSGAMGVLSAVTSAAAAVLTFFTTPLGLIVLAVTLVGLALAGGAIWFFKYSEAGQTTLSVLGAAFWGLWDTAKQAFGGIFDAIMSGRWDLAANVAMAGLEVAYRQGLLAIRTLWSGFKEWLLGLFADMFAGIFQMLADFQAKLVGGVNYIREKLGFEPIQGLQFVDNWAAGAAEKAGQMKAAAARNREQEIEASRDRLAQAQGRLDDATQAAQQARKDQAEKRKKKLSGLLDHVGQSPALPVTAPGGSTLGTFSASVAGLLGRSGPDTAAERTADATEAMEEHLAAIRDDIEEGGLAFE